MVLRLQRPVRKPHEEKRMRTSLVIILVPLATGATLLLPPRTARAADQPSTINPPPPPPRAPTTEAVLAERPYRRGVQAEAGFGTGFSSTYGLGLLGAVEYTWSQGILAGAQVQYFVGQTVNDRSSHAMFVGGEVGYRIFPSANVEVRPYAFVGPAFITTVSPTSNPNQPNVVSKTDLAVQPGVIAQYHFGRAFVGGDAHYMLTPSPNTLALMATAGLAF
jgi:hypothetical protein